MRRSLFVQVDIMRILITAGGTREYIDPVRYISNASSGRMGYALARAAQEAGHKVTLVTAPTSLCKPGVAQVVRVETASQMFAAVRKYFNKCDCLIMAAAVADYTPVKKSKTKIKKHVLHKESQGLSKAEGSKSGLTIRLKPTDDILEWAAKHKKVKSSGGSPHEIGRRPPSHGVKVKRRIVVGFALEDKGLRQNAVKKLTDKSLDMIVANTPASIGSDRSTVHIKTTQSAWEKIENADKAVIAERIILLVTELRNQA